MPSHRESAFVLSLAVTAAGAAASASPPDLFGVGPTSVAMGGTGASIASDYGAVYENPAGLALATERTSTLGYEAAGFDTWIARGGADREHHSIDQARGMILGMVVPIPLPGALRDRVTFGLALHLPTDIIGRNRVLRPETPQFLLLDSRAQSIALQGAVGVKLPLGFRLGGGASALSALGGSISIANDAAGDLTYRVDDRLVVVYSALAGVGWDWNFLHVGVAYRSELRGDINVNVTVRDLGIDLPPFDVSGLAQYDPHQVAGEIAATPGDWVFAAGVTYKLWHYYPGPLRATTDRVTRENNLPYPLQLADTLVARAGAQRTWTFGHSTFIARAGYFYEPTPVPHATDRANYLDCDRHAFTAGLSVGTRWRGTRMAVDLFGQYHVLVSRTDTKDASVAQDNPGYPSISYGGSMYFIALALTVSM